MTYDVIIIGSGIAGLNAALAATRHGLRPVVIEKSDRIGGASCWSYGATWVACNSQAQAAGIEDNIAKAEAYLGFLGSGEADPARVSALVRHAPRILDENEAAGIGFQLMRGVGDILHGKAPGAVPEGRTLEPLARPGAALGDWRARLRLPPADQMWRVQRSTVVRLPDPQAVQHAIEAAMAIDQLASGPALVAGLLLALLERDVPILLDTAAEALVVEHGRVVGVRTRQGVMTARQGVFLGAGGYLANTRLVAALDKIADYRSYFPPTSNGDSLMLAADIGASIRAIRNNVVIMLGFDDPAGHALQAGAPSTRELPRAHTMVVNASGRRFGNEANFQELSPGLRAMDWKARQPMNLPCWLITDQRYVARWGIAGSTPGTVPSFVVSAPTIEGLARETGIDASGLSATVAQFNAFSETGIDEDFRRGPGWAMVPGGGSGPNPSLGALADPPFYAVRLRPTLGAGGSGIKTDAYGRVMDWRDEALPGLYASGDAALHDEFGAGYQAGVTFTTAMTFAWLAIEHMAEAA